MRTYEIAISTEILKANFPKPSLIQVRLECKEKQFLQFVYLSNNEKNLKKIENIKKFSVLTLTRKKVKEEFRKILEEASK